MSGIDASRVAAVIPAWNEAGAIGPTIARLPRATVGRIVVVDAGSSDDTVEEARAAGAEVIVETRRGYGRACAAGAEHATRAGACILVFLDGDGADAGEQAQRLVGPIARDEADFVIGSRVRGEREAGSMGAHQVAAGRLAGAAVAALCGVRYTDMSAFRAIRSEALAALNMREMTYGWNLEMQMRVALHGLRVLEVPVPYRRRVAGVSKVSGDLRATLRAGGRIALTLLRVAYEARAERSRREPRPTPPRRAA